MVKIRNLQRKIKVDLKLIKRVGEETLRREGKTDIACSSDPGRPAPAEVSIVLVTDAYIRDLNRKYRGIDEATDVLAFPMQEGEFSGLNPGLLGDVVISVERTEKQSLEFKHEFEEELSLLVIHGILHLLGYDDSTVEDRKKMEARQREILKEVQLER